MLIMSHEIVYKIRHIGRAPTGEHIPVRSRIVAGNTIEGNNALSNTMEILGIGRAIGKSI